MATPLNPLDFGYSMDEVYTVSSGYGESEVHSLRPKQKFIKEPRDSRAKRWYEAVDNWKQASRTWNGREPTEYKELSSQVKRYTTSNDPETEGSIIRTAQGVYVNGKLHARSNWVDTTVLGRWHKLTTVSKRLRVGSC